MRRGLAEATNLVEKARLEEELASWLFRLVRANVRRGRVFDLEEVLMRRQADCLGYARLLANLGSEFGLDMGVVEVVVDFVGRHVPHLANLLNLSNHERHFLDLWYASLNIRHHRIGALADGRVRDLDWDELPQVSRLEGLPERCLQALELYIRGNHLLGQGNLDEAIELYSRAIELYPENARIFYNRGIAFERRGDLRKAEEDYHRALSDEAGLARILARVDELEKFIELDEKGLSEEEQGAYFRGDSP